MNNEYLIKSHISRLASILTKYAILSFVCALLIYIALIGQALLVFLVALLIILWFLLGIVLIGIPFLDEGFRSFPENALNFSMGKNDFLLELTNYAPHLLIVSYALIIISLILFIISKKIPRSKIGIILTSCILIITILIFLLLMLIIIVVATQK